MRSSLLTSYSSSLRQLWVTLLSTCRSTTFPAFLPTCGTCFTTGCLRVFILYRTLMIFYISPCLSDLIALQWLRSSDVRGSLFWRNGALLQLQNNRQCRRTRQDMLVIKKSRPAEEKGKHRGSEIGGKKVKKLKQSPTVKGKLTPDKKRTKKEEAQISKHFQNTQISDFFKSKDRETARPSQNSKKPLHSSSRIKLLTTSPVLIEPSKSKSNSRKKQKSKSRSVSRLNTQRSQQQDKEILKSAKRKLYGQNKQNNRDKSNTKSMDKSKSRNKDVSPLRDQRFPREFNVTDRQVKYLKTEPNELRKTLKKKVQSRMKAEAFFFPTESDPIIAEHIQQPKVKLKKKVTQIKTEFSERRGSYFDQNLLKKLEINHLDSKKVDNNPFSHIRSNFQAKIEKTQQEAQMTSQIKTYEESSNQETASKNKDIQNFKREQEMRWQMMLNQLNSLKHEKKVPEKIDRLIEELSRNYNSLQEKATELSKDTKSYERPSQNNGFINNVDISFEVRAKNSMDEIEQLEFDRELAKQAKLSQKNIQTNNFFIKQQRLEQQKQTKLKIDNTNSQVAIIKRRSQDVIKLQQPSQPFKLESKIEIESKFIEQQKNETIIEPAKDDSNQQIQFKRSNAITINTDFYSFIQNHKESVLKEQFGSLINFKGNDIENISIQLIRQSDQHKISDKNLLKELDIFDDSNQSINEDDLTFCKQNKVAFFFEMQQIRQSGDDEPRHTSFHSELKMHEELSSESMLLVAVDRQEQRKKETIVQQIEQTLVLQFCANILKSKTILHNFLVTYSELVDQKVINTNNSSVPELRPRQDLSNDYILTLLSRLLNHFEINYQDYFMCQIKIPFECKPIDILRYIRSSEEDVPLQQSSDANDEMTLQLPFFDMAKIEEFETQVLRNQYYIPNYFSFNNCVYDLFNDVFDELRPYGSNGKSIFSLELGHPVKKFSVAKKLMASRFETILSQKYHQEGLQNDQPPSSEGVFEIIYFTCVDIMQDIFLQECQQIMRLLSRRTNY